MKKFVLLLCLIPFSLLSQEQFDHQPSEALHEYFKNNTLTLHIHTNKTTYFANEDIWFSVYGFNKATSKIISDNHNIIIGLYDENSIQLQTALLYLSEGRASGSFFLKPDTPSGTYYVKAYTDQMNVLDHDESFVKPIKIINPNEDQVGGNTSSHIEPITFDIQVLPEGGHLVANTNNICGIKIIDPFGKGVTLENLQLIDGHNNVIVSDLRTNKMGMSKFSFIPNADTKYFITHSKTNTTSSLPNVQKNGITINSQQNFTTGDLQISLITNSNTLPQLINKDITLLIHKNKLSKGYVVKFEQDYPEIVLNIPNKDLFLGVNTVTVLDENNRPLLERLFFNNKSINPVETVITQVRKKQDTFSYSILNKLNKQTIISNTSISVLPATSSANLNASNIYASVYLKPFLKGHIENPDYYFKRSKNQKQYEIDLLLLNQGWSKYKWSNIFNKQNRIKKKKSPGITIRGYVKPMHPKHTIKNVLLYSKTNEKIQIQEVNTNQEFVFTDLELRSNSNFEFSATDVQGKPIIANFFYTISPRTETLNNKFIIHPFNPFKINNFTQDYQEIFKFKGERLDEVIVKATPLKYEKFLSGRYGIKVDSTLYSYNTIGDYFKATEGLRAIYYPVPSNSYFYVAPQDFYATYQSPEIATIIIDGMIAKINNGLFNIPMKYITEIYHGGRDGYGARRPHFAFTDGNYNSTPKSLRTSKAFNLKDNGFTLEKEFYIPLYNNYESENYLKFGIISWHKNIITDEFGYSNITLTNPGLHDLVFFIEGFSESGEPISNVVTVKHKTNP